MTINCYSTESLSLFRSGATRACVCLILFLNTAAGVGEVRASKLEGKLELGDAKPSWRVSGVRVTLYEAGNSKPIKLGHDRTDRNGRFSIRFSKGKSKGVFFVAADFDSQVRFVTVLGSKLPNKTTINELTTVASSYSMAQFYRSGRISGDRFRLQLAAGMNDNIVRQKSGKSSPVLRNSPNADETDSLRMTRSLANILNRCATGRVSVTRSLLRATRDDKTGKPKNTAEALANLARNPGKDPSKIYQLARFGKPYRPALKTAPEAWTVTVKVNNSGNDSILIGGPGNVAFDSRGYAWIANNVTQGTPDSSRYIMVLQPNGKPSDGTNGTPKSPVSGGGILGAGWGVSVDAQDRVWIGNFGWGNKPGDQPTAAPPGNGSVSLLYSDGSAISPADGYYADTLKVQAIEPDALGNIWMASFGNDSVVVFPKGDHLLSQGFPQYAGSAPFGVGPTPDGSAWVTNSGGLGGGTQSSVARFELNAMGVLERPFFRPVGNTLKVIASDSMGNGWLASQGDSMVYAFPARATGADSPLGAYTGGGIDGPWGIAVDGEDNIWVSNFGPLDLNSNFTEGRISKLCGANPDAWPQGMTRGDPISPPTGYRARSAGSQVLLADGNPLYGPGADPSYAPMMRQTSLQIDAAGNVWTINNWKPYFNSDFNPLTGNPGGDGIIIFVGLAPPPLN